MSDLDMYEALDSVREATNDIQESAGVIRGRVSMGAEFTAEHAQNMEDAANLLKAANELLERNIS